jgi:hypothetical protein
MTYYAGDECIRSYVLVCSQMFSEPTLYIDEDTHNQAKVIRSNLVRHYDKRAAVWEVTPGRDKNRKAGYITHSKNYQRKSVNPLGIFSLLSSSIVTLSDPFSSSYTQWPVLQQLYSATRSPTVTLSDPFSNSYTQWPVLQQLHSVTRSPAVTLSDPSSSSYTQWPVLQQLHSVTRSPTGGSNII